MNKRNFQIENIIHSKVDKCIVTDNLDVHIHELEELQKLEIDHKSLVNVKGVIISKQLIHPNNKSLQKYELSNMNLNMCIQLMIWNDETDIAENFEYIFKYICIGKYEDGLTLTFSTFTTYEQIKKTNKNKLSNNLIHLSKNNFDLVLFSEYLMFYNYSNGYLFAKILNIKKKSENQYQFKLCAT